MLKRSFAWRFNLGKSKRKTVSQFPADPLFWSWLAGFIDGDASFKVTIKKKATAGIGFEVMPCIDILQGVARKEQMEMLAFELSHSLLIEKKSLIGKNMCSLNIYRFEDIKAVMEKIMPHLRFKRDDGFVFVEILNLIEDGFHLTVDGFLKIAKLREKIASSRTKPKTYRKYLWFKNYFKDSEKHVRDI